jgi:hypothetical protein
MNGADAVPVGGWRRSTRCGGGGDDCVEVLLGHETVWMRDSKDPVGPVLEFDHESWLAFVSAVKRGRFGCE